MTKNLSQKVLLCAGLIFCIYCPPAAFAQSLSLDSCLALARRNNADIRTSQLEMQKAQAVKQQVFTKYFPKVQMGAMGYVAAKPMISFGIDNIQSDDLRSLLSAIYEVFSMVTDINDRLELMRNGMSGSVVAMQPLYAGGRIVTGNKLASLGEDAARLQAEVKERDVLESVQATYFLVVGLQEKEATLQAALTLIDSLEHMVSSALEHGLVTRADALQVELKRNEITSQHQKLTSGIRLTRRLLCTQIGIEYSDSIAFSDKCSSVEVDNNMLATTGQPQTNIQSRPESQLLQLNVESKRLMKRMAVGETLPQLALFAVGYYGNPIRNYADGNAIVGLNLTIPITDWWATSHKLKEHSIQIEQAQIMQKNLSEMMTLEEEKAYSDMVDAWMLIKSDSSALNIARENYRLATVNYSAGATTLSEVLQAQTLLLQAENAVTDRRLAYLEARRRLKDLRAEGD